MTISISFKKEFCFYVFNGSVVKRLRLGRLSITLYRFGDEIVSHLTEKTAKWRELVETGTIE
jgi:hypothetical protein